jgi:hypothetical protein
MDPVNKHRKGGFTMKKMAVGIAFLFLALAAAAWAGPPDQIRGKMDNLQQRIDEGVKSGKLTGQEAKGAQNQLNSIRRGFDNAVKNGLSDREAKQFNQRLDTLSKEVYKEKHDREDTRSAGRIDHRISELQQQIDDPDTGGDKKPSVAARRNPRPLRAGTEGWEADRPGNPGDPGEAGFARKERRTGEKRSGTVPVAPYHPAFTTLLSEIDEWKEWELFLNYWLTSGLFCFSVGILFFGRPENDFY